jgi:hypothetical protein
MGAHILLPLAVNSKSEQKFESLLLLGLKPVAFGTPMHRSDHDDHDGDDDDVKVGGDENVNESNDGDYDHDDDDDNVDAENDKG